MSNQWIITHDVIEAGQANGTTSAVFNPAKPMPVEFMMYDDDGILYFKGIMENEDFRPLDDFGMPGYGCTELKYRKNGSSWEVL